MEGLSTARASDTQFALLSYDTENLGDEIQSIAAAQFLPRIDTYINREYTSSFSPPNKARHKLILNGWFMHLPNNWPPSEFVAPLIISFHMNTSVGDSGFAPHSKMLSSAGIQYLNRFGPVGARDLSTLKILQAAGVDSYFSGCLTLTLPRPSVSRDDNLIIVNDIPSTVTQRIRDISQKKVVGVDQNSHVKDHRQRFKLAYTILEKYARASFVVTSRLHCALPCLALGTPVVFIKSDRDPGRFGGLENLLHSYSVDQFFTLGSRDIDFPQENKRDYVALRRELIRRVEGFVGAYGIRKVSPFQKVLGADPQISQIVEAAYKSILGRAPDEGGLRMYSEMLRREGLSQGCEQMFNYLLHSNERKSLENRIEGRDISTKA